MKVEILRTLKAVLICCVVIWIGLYWYLRNPQFSSGTNVTSDLTMRSDLLERHVRYLSDLKPNRSFRNEASLIKARDYIVEKLKESGYEVRLQEVAGAGRTFHNVVARHGSGEAKEIVVVGAHYDVADEQNPGADDNASGVAGLLERARLIQERKPKLKFPVEFVAYTLEEPPFFGSVEMGSVMHADTLKEAGITVKAMLSLEMIGYYTEESFSQDFPIPILAALYPTTGNFIGAVGRPQDRDLMGLFGKEMAANCDVPLVTINAPGFVQGVDFSDHRSYWAHDWPAIMITDTAFLRNKEYHHPGDTADRLNYEKAAQVVRGVYGGLLLLAN